MADRFRPLKQQTQAGFTLIELLVVITILGILAAIVVFSVAGVGDKGQLAACKTDTATIRTAEEANFAKFTTYDSLANLKANGFLSTSATLHTVATNNPAPNATSYTLSTVVGGPTCTAAGGTGTTATLVDGSTVF